MKSADDLKKLFKNATINTNPAGDRAVINDALGAAGLTAGRRWAHGRAGIGRSIMRSSITKFAVAAAVLVAVAAGFLMVGGSRPAFAEVVGPLLTAHTVVYKVAMNTPDGPGVVGEAQFMAPAKMRQTTSFGEASPTGMILIADYEQGKALGLLPLQKTAMVMEMKDAPKRFQTGMFNPFELLRDLIQKAQVNPDESVRYLGASQIQGRKVVGYRVTVEDTSVTARLGEELTIWADAESLLPVQVECSLQKVMGTPATMTMSDIQFDVPLDPNQFSLVVPEGYTEHAMQVDASRPTEADLIETLRIWTDATGGVFPSALNMAATKEMFKALGETGKMRFGKEPSLNDPGVQQFVQLFQKVNRGLTFVTTLPKQADAYYGGADVTRGDATKPIFWYRPEGSTTYRVIYADLSVLDVPFESLPK